jgi:phosphatidylinositol alpha-1,6-mannosyltransferase
VALRQLAYWRATRALWRQWCFERIICGYLATHGPLALWWRLRYGVPFVVLTYGMELRSAERSRAAPFYRWILERAKLVVTIAEPFSILVKRFAPKARVRKIPLGCRALPAAGDRSAAEAARPELAGKRVVLSVGRLQPRKGFDVTLRALARLLAEGRDLIYVAVGDGPDRTRLEQLARELGVSERVIFAGKVDDAKLAALYARADVFTMPSREEGTSVEGFGLVFVEAGAAGVPVIGGRSGGVCEVVREGENGLLVEPLDAEALATAIARVLDDPQLAARFGAEGRRLAREVFTFEAMCSTLVAELASAGSAG